MDVDLLRPGTVPISPDTVLWFEFLLDKDLLLKHLQKPNPDPSPIELVHKFTVAIFESYKNEAKRPETTENGGEAANSASEPPPEVQAKQTVKNVALKILSLKVAAYLKWNLASLMTLPFKIQASLLQDLLYFTNNHVFVEIPNLGDCDHAGASQEYLFALLVYHRWLIATFIRRIFCIIPLRAAEEITLMEESFICSEENIDRSLKFLGEALGWETRPPMLSFDCFVMLSENKGDIDHEWEHAVLISRNEFHAQLHFELACFHFYRENYDSAKAFFQNALHCFKQLEDKVGFVSFEPEILEGYLSACQVCLPEMNKSLLYQLSVCVANQYTGILTILSEDNKKKEIPLAHRINLELDIKGALSSGKFTVARDLLPKIQALNAVRCILDQKGTQRYTFGTSKSQDFLIWAASSVWNTCNVCEKKLISSYILQLVIGNKMPDFLAKLSAHEVFAGVLNKDAIDSLSDTLQDVKIPSLLEDSSWSYPELNPKRNPKLEIRALEQQIIMCYDPQKIRELLVKVTVKNSNRSVWKLNPRWELPIPLQSVIMAIPRGFLQDYGFVLLAKARELMTGKDWNSSLLLLRALEAEIKNHESTLTNKLSKLLTWEILLVEVTQLLEECPAPQIDKQALANSCKACLETNDSILPRTEVVEQCVLCLLNLGYWDFFITLDKHFSYFEFATAIATACQDLNKYKGTKKLPKELWDLTLPAFVSSSSQSKRSASGGSAVVHRDSPMNNTKMMLLSFFTRLRDATALRVVISLLARLYNVLKDESTLELNVEHSNLWPAVITNANSYNTDAVGEVLTQIVEQALKFYPYNVSWFRLMGDINFVKEKYENALNCYLKSLVICNEYFNVPIRPDDHIYRRMIKTCASLGCYTQAAVLCQFLEEPDYLSAFRYLSEQKTCNDAVDAYYNYFWDSNILEYLIHMHHKKGEFQRRKRAVETMGLLELNSNNNEEIVREASNHRKSTFLRAMCKQYVH